LNEAGVSNADEFNNLKVVVDAHRYMESNEQIGKIVVTVP
jgi:hypothetical protein